MSKKKLSQRLKSFGNESVKHYNIALIIILGTITAMILESTSLRSKHADGETTYWGSLFSAEFGKRIGQAVNQFFQYVCSINKYVFIIMLLTILATCVVYFKNQKSRSHPAIILAIICLIAGPFLFVFDVLLAAKAGPWYLGEARCVYGPFFFLVLFIGLLLIYVFHEIKPSRPLFPFVLVAILLMALNSDSSYRSHGNEYMNYLANPLVATFTKADRLGYTNIVLYMPETSPAIGYLLETIPTTLHNHHITMNRINIEEIIISTNGKVYFTGQ
jgi:hypothetical protein